MPDPREIDVPVLPPALHEEAEGRHQKWLDDLITGGMTSVGKELGRKAVEHTLKESQDIGFTNCFPIHEHGDTPDAKEGKGAHRDIPDAKEGKGTIEKFKKLLMPPTEEQRQEAKDILDERADLNDRPDGLKLNDAQKQTLKLLGRAVLDGDSEAVDNLLKVAGGKDPNGLRDVMNALQNDLDGTGVHVQYSVADMRIGGEENSHPVGQLTIYSEGVSKYVQFSTDKHFGPAVGGSVSWKDGMATMNYMSFREPSADGVLEQIGDRATRRLAPIVYSDEVIPLSNQKK